MTFSDVSSDGRGVGFAKLLCIKRDTFRHEKEVRILFQDNDFFNPKRGKNGVFGYPLDPNSLFEEVVLDPRSDDSQVADTTAKLVAGGCRLSIRRSQLYQAPTFTIEL